MTRTPSSFICFRDSICFVVGRERSSVAFWHPTSPECCYSLTSRGYPADTITESIVIVNHTSEGSYSILRRVVLRCGPFRHVVCNFSDDNPANGNPGECEFSKPHNCQQPTPVCQTTKKAEPDPSRLFSCAQLVRRCGTVRPQSLPIGHDSFCGPHDCDFRKIFFDDDLTRTFVPCH